MAYFPKTANLYNVTLWVGVIGVCVSVVKEWKSYLALFGHDSSLSLFIILESLDLLSVYKLQCPCVCCMLYVVPLFAFCLILPFSKVYSQID